LATVWNIRLAQSSDAAGITDIYTPIVRDTHLSAELEPPDVEEMRRRVESTLQTHPWLVAEGDGGIVGYAYATSFRSRPAYQWTAEVSVYIRAGFRRHGLARRLYSELLDRLRDQGFRHAIAVIALPNPESVAFHEQFGFLPVGVFPGICHKLGRWYDIGWWRYALNSSAAPPPPLNRNNLSSY
jgi:phosphinothricin acetyltransferase